MSFGFKEHKLVFEPGNVLTMTGVYGEKIVPSDIRTVDLVNQLPEMTMKTNGFAPLHYS